MRLLVLPALALALTGCVDSLVDRSISPEDPLTAPGAAAGPGGVDPLIVGDRLMAADEPEMALAAYTRAATQHGLTPGIQMAMAATNARMGRLNQAERLLRDVVEAEPRNAPALNDLGVVLLQMGEIGEAHRILRAAFALQPTPEIRDNLRVSAARLEERTYVDVEEEAFTLTRRADGTYGLLSPGQQ